MEYHSFHALVRAHLLFSVLGITVYKHQQLECPLRLTRIVKGLEIKPCEEGLKELNMCSLQKRNLPDCNRGTEYLRRWWTVLCWKILLLGIL